MSLKKYHQKRDFKETAEPRGKKAAAKKKQKLEFVVQEHHATALHYDFRLELDGVLKSWAVPKGPSLNPHDRHLAMMVEDHPFEYRKFEGTIPKGNYGAGEVIIWDKGTYEPYDGGDDPQKVLRKQLKDGHLTFIVHGQKLHGEFALIKMKNAKQPNAWLLVKKGDEFASEKIDITKEQDKSVVSGKSLNEPNRDYKQYPKRKLTEPVKPMLSTLVHEPFNDKEWLFEIKWDGYRAIASKQGSDVALYSRNNLDFREKYPAVAEAVRDIQKDVILDGEIVVTDKDGRSHFEWLQGYKPSGTLTGELYYYVFDLLWFEGHDIRDMPLIERKQLLQSIIPENSIVRYSDHVERDGKKLFAAIKKQHLEGIMAKKSQGAYRTNIRSKHWLKIKTHERQEVVIGGFTEPRGTRKHLGSLVVGVYSNEGELIYVGHSGGGIPDAQLKSLRERLEKLERADSPFQTEPKPNAPVHWVEPKLVCEMEFSEWTSEGYMRHPSFVGLREDKDPKKVHKEEPKDIKPTKKREKTMKRQPTDELKLTHLDKVFWPEHGYTKGDLIEYYRSVSKYILPYLKNRPQSMKRNPDGVDGFSFFQKNVTFDVPSFAHTIRHFSDSTGEYINYLICNNEKTLLFMAQLGCIEINPWNSRVGHLEDPDWLVIDLDPEGVEFKDVVQVAKTVHEVCDEWKVPNFPKTSGKRGIHVYVPLRAKYNYEQARNFAHLIAMEVHKREPELTSLERSPSKRKHKIYLDYLQNSEGQTLASPYSARPSKDATVSAPLHWDEVNGHLTPQRFTIKNMAKRIEKEGDLWEGVRGKGADIKAVLRHLS